MAALVEDVGARMVEGLNVFGLEDEIVRDPLFVQGTERGCVLARLEGAYFDVRRESGRGHFMCGASGGVSGRHGVSFLENKSPIGIS